MRGIAFTMFTIYLLLIFLAIYVAHVKIPTMPEYRSYLNARLDASEHWWDVEVKGAFPQDSMPQGGCVSIIDVFPYNESLSPNPGPVYGDDMNTIAPVVKVTRCAP